MIKEVVDVFVPVKFGRCEVKIPVTVCKQLNQVPMDRRRKFETAIQEHLTQLAHPVAIGSSIDLNEIGQFRVNGCWDTKGMRCNFGLCYMGADADSDTKEPEPPFRVFFDPTPQIEENNLEDEDTNLFPNFSAFKIAKLDNQIVDTGKDAQLQ